MAAEYDKELKNMTDYQNIRSRRWRPCRPPVGQRHQNIAPQLSTISPRWLVHMLQWLPVGRRVFSRLEPVKNASNVQVACSGARDEAELPQTYVDYEQNPREYFLNAVTTVLDVHTRVSDLYSSPHDQIREQLRLTIETIKERQESELINNPEYGLLSNIDPTQRISTLTGAPTPDDLDELLTKVWKEPGFFLAHPLAIAAFGRECTAVACRRPPSACLAASSDLARRAAGAVGQSCRSWTARRKSLLRVGEKLPGRGGSVPAGSGWRAARGLSVRFMGISRNAIASYLISLYCSLAVLTGRRRGRAR